jgi:hypothetical protein
MKKTSEKAPVDAMRPSLITRRHCWLLWEELLLLPMLLLLYLLLLIPVPAEHVPDVGRVHVLDWLMQKLPTQRLRQRTAGADRAAEWVHLPCNAQQLLKLPPVLGSNSLTLLSFANSAACSNGTSCGCWGGCCWAVLSLSCLARAAASSCAGSSLPASRYARALFRVSSRFWLADMRASSAGAMVIDPGCKARRINQVCKN